MNSFWPAAGFVALTLVWFLLPLIPAILELVRPTDLAPLSVVPRDAGDVAFLARGFRGYLAGQVAQLPPGTPDDYLGRLPDGTRFARVRTAVAALEPLKNGQDRVVRLEVGGAIPGGQTFLQEVHAAAAVAGGPDTTYRAVLGDADVTLGRGSRVLRWIHAAGALQVGEGSVLQGRASSDRRIVLEPGVQFDRIGAPEILVSGALAPMTAGVPARTAFVAPEHSRRIGDFLRVEGDLAVPDGAEVEGHLVVTGSLTLGAGVLARGSLKAHGSLSIGARAEVRGAVVARGDITVAERAVVAGPVIGEGAISLGTGAVVGMDGSPTTVAGDVISVAAGVAVHGQMTARNGGHATT